MKVDNPKNDWSENKDFELKDQETAVRIVEIDDKVLYIKCTDPHSMWRIHTKRGKVPKKLSGAYLTAFDAQQAIKMHYDIVKPRTINQKHREKLGLD